MKKALKIFGIAVLVVLIALIAIPYMFKGTIQDKVKHLIHQHVHANVDFADINLSLLRNFPKASVIIEDLSVITHAPFEGDTLVYSKKIALNMSVNQVFKSSSKAIDIERIVIDQANIAIKTDSLGNSNYDIAKKEATKQAQKETQEEGEGDFTFDLEHYEINDSRILFQDDVSKTRMLIDHLNHSGDGKVSGDHIILDTHTDTEASFSLGETEYLNKNKLQLDAALDLDLTNQKYTFKENKLLINRLPLAFDGFVQLFDNYMDMDLSFKTPTADFKNFLAVIPQSYTRNLNSIQTTGDFSIQGIVKGKSDDNTIPKFDVTILSHDASFKYPDLPKQVKNINIDTKIKNETGLADDTYVHIDNLTFGIDQDSFAAKGNLQHLTTNMVVDLMLKGKLNLANLNQAYPLELEQKLNGIIVADVNTHFDMESLEKEQYQHVKSTGTASISKFVYASEETPNQIKIDQAKVSFTPKTVSLNQLDASTGQSDLSATGTITNLMGFLFTDQDLKGVFDVNSNVFAVNDFMVSEETEENQDANQGTNKTATKTSEETMKIPSFLDATLNFDTKKVIYDNINLTNTKGTVKIKNETAYLENVTSNIFDGGLAFNGNVSTKSDTPVFDMALDLRKIDIAQSFNNLDLIKGLAPIARALTGNLTTQLNLNGKLKDDLTPVLTSLKGKALTQILNAKVSASQTPLLSKLNNQLKFVELNKLNLKDIKTKLSFEDGKIKVKPFDFDVQGITVKAAGEHSFEQNMNYTVTLDVPAKYLGNEVGGVMSQLSDKEANTMTVGLPIGLTGNFANPKINLNTGQAVKELTQQIISSKKKKAKDQLANTGKKAITDLLGGSKKTSDSSKTEPTKTKDALKNTAKNILGGFLGKKKKKDSLNQ